MLNHDLRREEGILVLRPEGPLEAADFEGLAAHVDAYLQHHGTLHGVMIVADSFPGWKNFAALFAHMRFVKSHHRKIEKVAVVVNDGFAIVMPHMASYLFQVEVRQFDRSHEAEAWQWLTRDRHTEARTAA